MRFSKRLKDRIDLISIDLPSRARAVDGMKLAFANIAALPFSDKSFDLVICCEVFEHLSEANFERGIRELQRVARRYLLISVPYRQRVWNEMFRCARCGFTGNAMQHLRYFDEAKLRLLFPKATVRHEERIASLGGYAPDWLYRIANVIGNAWQKYTYDTCPGCRGPAVPCRPNFVGEALLRIIWRLEGVAPRRAAWLLTLFEIGAPSDGPLSATR